MSLLSSFFCYDIFSGFTRSVNILGFKSILLLEINQSTKKIQTIIIANLFIIFLGKRLTNFCISG